jgi:predicted Zn-dependent protease
MESPRTSPSESSPARGNSPPPTDSSVSGAKSTWLVPGILITLMLGFGLGYVIRLKLKSAEHLHREQLLLQASSGQADSEPGLRKLLASNPDDLEVIKALLGLKLRANDSIAADQLLQAWSKVEPQSLKPLQLRFEIASRSQNYTLAVQLGDKLLEVQTDSIPLLRKLIALELAGGMLADAARHAELALQSEPNDPGLRLQRAQIYHQNGEPKEAIILLEKLLQNTPSNLGGHLLIGTIYREQNQPSLAVPYLRKALAEDPNSRTRQVARYQLAQALYQLDQQSEADRLMAAWHRYESARRLLVDAYQQPNNIDLGIRAAQQLLDNEQEPEGLAVLDEILRQQPAHSQAHELLAQYFEKRGDRQRALMHRQLARRGS